MKWSLCFVVVAISMVALNAQDLDQSTNSLFDDSAIKTYAPKSILVQGEVQAPTTVDLGQLPLRSVAIKELGLENGKQVFKGAYFVSGYSLYDILANVKIKKAAENTFKPSVDLYVIVENDKGEKSVFSWGEIYYRNSFDLLITKSIQAINPARSNNKWTLPDEPRLISGGDLLNVRFISNPARITVKSYFENSSAGKPKDLFSPEIKISTKAGSANIRDLGASIEKRKYQSVIYGHGMGFKEVFDTTGYLFKDVLAAQTRPAAEDLKSTLVVVSAKDGYHVVFSASEILNRNDNHDYMLNDLKDSAVGGRYTLVVTPDYFADRDVRSVEKIVLKAID
jgi:hypothetical protein